MSNRPSKHAPARISQYFKAHTNNMDWMVRSGFVGSDTLEIEQFAGSWLIYGDIGCQGEIAVHVEKLLEEVDGGPDSDPLIQTVAYSYNASLRRGHSILRIDNQHPREGHPDNHHRHDFDVTTGEEIPGSPKCIGAENWPTLGEYMAILREWFWKNHGPMLDPDLYAVPQPASLRVFSRP